MKPKIFFTLSHDTKFHQASCHINRKQINIQKFPHQLMIICFFNPHTIYTHPYRSEEIASYIHNHHLAFSLIGTKFWLSMSLISFPQASCHIDHKQSNVKNPSPTHDNMLLQPPPPSTLLLITHKKIASYIHNNHLALSLIGTNLACHVLDFHQQQLSWQKDQRSSILYHVISTKDGVGGGNNHRGGT